MKINKKMDNDTLIVELEGRLDTSTSPELDAELQNLDGIAALIIDMKNLQYISSAGLRVLLRAKKKMGKKRVMEIHNVNEIVSEILEVTGFNDFLTVV